MKRIFPFLIILSILMFACNISTTVTPLVATEPPVISDTPTNTVPAVETETPTNTLSSIDTETPTSTVTPTITQTPFTTNVTCNKLSLYLEPSLASGYTCETIAESPDGMEVYPQYTNLVLKGYGLSGKFFEPHISVFPIQRYSELLPDLLPARVSALLGLINGVATGDSLPFLPTFNAAQVFHAQYLALSFRSGGGIRYLTEYAQYYAPVNNNELFYTYQGLTSDGKYWVSAILPINNPILPADSSTPPGGQTWEQFSNNFATYIADMINQLNSQPSAAYAPALSALDALASSITIQP